MTKLAIIHTTPVTVDSLKALVTEIMPGTEVVNFVDDSILPQLRANDGDTSAVADRLTHYARFAEQVGADVILSACSSVGELAPALREQVSIPVVRIDEAMAEQAVQGGTRLGVAATMPTTLKPTMALLKRKAEEAGAEIALEPVVVAEAYERLMAGDREGHDDLLVAALTDLASRNDVVVLAQASMARVLPRIPEDQRAKFLTSPRLAVERVKTVMNAVAR